MLKVVIARSHEDIKWTEKINKKYFIYNKGSDLECYCEKLNNIGREAHTFLYHIVKHYNNLDEYTCFCQGNPFDHEPNFIDLINNFDSNSKIGVIFDNGCYGLGKLHEEKFKAWPESLFAWKLYESLFYGHVEKFSFVAGAQYIIHKNNIKSHSKRFYEFCLNGLEKNESKSGFDPWSFERLWSLIFRTSFLFSNKIDAIKVM